MRRLRRSAGFSMVESAVALAFFAGLAAAMGGVFATTTGLTNRVHADVSSGLSNRRSLEHIADLLRGASGDTMSGFDATGVATTLRFQWVTGMSGNLPVYSSTATLKWSATPTSVTGVSSPGEVVMEQGGVTRRVAARVPSGGFYVTQSGNGVSIHLETYAPLVNGGVSRASGDTFVSLRN